MPMPNFCLKIFLIVAMTESKINWIIAFGIGLAEIMNSVQFMRCGEDIVQIRNRQRDLGHPVTPGTAATIAAAGAMAVATRVQRDLAVLTRRTVMRAAAVAAERQPISCSTTRR